MKRFKIFFLNSIIMVISSIILQVIRLSFGVYVSNKVTPETLGVFGLIMSTYYFGITLACSGINISCIRVVSEELAFRNHFGVKKASKKCIKISLILSLIASFIFYINSDFIVSFCFHSKVSKNIVHLICCALPLISVSSAITGYFVAVRRAYKTVIGSFLEQLSKFIMTVLLFNIFKANSSIENMCFILILADVISEIVAFTYLTILYFFDIRKHFSNIKISSSGSFLKRIFHILFPVALTSYIKSALSTLKQLLIPSSLEKNGKNTGEAFSEYGIISGMAMPIVMFPATFLVAFANLLIPEFSRYYVKEDYKKIKFYTDKLIVVSFLFALVLGIIFYLFADNLGVLIYHNTKASVYIKLFSLLIPFMYVDIIIDNILKGLDAQASVVVINVIDLIITTSFIFFFVPVLGVKGYVLSVFISEILNLVLSLRKLLKLENSWEV